MFLMFLITATLLIGSEYYIDRYPTVPYDNGSLCEEGDSIREYRYNENVPICNRRVSSSTKRKVYERYGIPERHRKDYTIDHLIPLSISGSNDFDNLWPQHKDIHSGGFEYEVYVKLREGYITHHEAICRIVEFKGLSKTYWDCL